MVVSLDGQAMADGTTSVGFSGRQGFKSVNTTIHEATLRKTEDRYPFGRRLGDYRTGVRFFDTLSEDLDTLKKFLRSLSQ
jgi:hypothetical protein